MNKSSIIFAPEMILKDQHKKNDISEMILKMTDNKGDSDLWLVPFPFET